MKKASFVSILFAVLTAVPALSQDRPSGVAQVTSATTRAVDQPKGYVFGPGDEIAVRVVSEPDYSFPATVDENGLIEVPYLEAPMMAQCKTQRELIQDIQKVFSKYLVKPQVTIEIKKRARPPVTVFGEVVSATKFDLTRRATLMELIANAGGPTKEAGQIVQVYRPQRMACSDDREELNWKADSEDPAEIPSRIFKLSALNQGNPADNPVIVPGDIIFVPIASPIYVVGEVRAPGSILLKRDGGTTLFQAITMVGGPSGEAKTKNVKIYRRKAGSSKQEELSANYELIRAGKEPDILLEPYDVVVMDKTKESLALTIAKFAIGAGKQVVTAAATQGGNRVISY
jgi:protein involved in polysaccharide export with SLBB domain